MAKITPPITIASPCPKLWEEMTGDARKRFCEHCQLHVHNLSGMTDGERDQFVAEMSQPACIAYELRTDGSMVTPTRWSWLTSPTRRIGWRMLTAFAAFLPMFFGACTSRRNMVKPAVSQNMGRPAPVEQREMRMMLGEAPMQPQVAPQDRRRIVPGQVLPPAR